MSYRQIQFNRSVNYPKKFQQSFKSSHLHSGYGFRRKGKPLKIRSSYKQTNRILEEQDFTFSNGKIDYSKRKNIKYSHYNSSESSSGIKFGLRGVDLRQSIPPTQNRDTGVNREFYRKTKKISNQNLPLSYLGSTPPYRRKVGRYNHEPFPSNNHKTNRVKYRTSSDKFSVYKKRTYYSQAKNFQEKSGQVLRFSNYRLNRYTSSNHLIRYYVKGKSGRLTKTKAISRLKLKNLVKKTAIKSLYTFERQVTEGSSDETDISNQARIKTKQFISKPTKQVLRFAYKKNKQLRLKRDYNHQFSQRSKMSSIFVNKRQHPALRAKKIVKGNNKTHRVLKFHQKIHQYVSTKSKRLVSRLGNFAKKTFNKLISWKTILCSVIVALLLSLVFMVGTFLVGSIEDFAELSYMFNSVEATRIEKTYSEKEMAYLKKITDEANQYKDEDNVVIDYDPVGHEPHDVLALFNVMLTPKYLNSVNNKYKIDWNEINTIIDELIEARYEFKKEKQGDKIILRSRTKSISNAVAEQSVDAPKNADEFIGLIGEYAREVAGTNGLYASVMIAQAILESDSGRSDLASPPYFNLFGIKGSYQG
ncbi:hypothetical protein HMPREF2829_03730 [Aerococcus sp. HMSC072A12]|nr:glucosaminidase domain-containing protein [Aerococcus sp. HMSC072A12]OFK21387.1 hypothetical protein HMPREF2829_03730 [Aerococcus sp. HMSC072A12]